MSSVQRATSTSQARPACAAWSGCGEGSTTAPPVLSTTASRPSWPVKASPQLLLVALSGQLPCLVVWLAPVFILCYRHSHLLTLTFIHFTLTFVLFYYSHVLLKFVALDCAQISLASPAHLFKTYLPSVTALLYGLCWPCIAQNSSEDCL